LSFLRIVSVAIVVAILAGCTSAGNTVGLAPNAAKAASTSLAFPYHPYQTPTHHVSHRRRHHAVHQMAMRPMVAASQWKTIWYAFQRSGTNNDYVGSVVFNPSLSCATNCVTPGYTITNEYIVNPTAIAVDGSGNVFVANAGTSAAANGSVTEFYSATSYALPCVLPGLYEPQNISISGTGANETIWVGTLKNPNASPVTQAAVTQYTAPCVDTGGPGLDTIANAFIQNWSGSTFDDMRNPQSTAFGGSTKMLTVGDPGTKTVSNYNLADSTTNGGNTNNGMERVISPFINPQALTFDNSNNNNDPNDYTLFVADQGVNGSQTLSNAGGGVGRITAWPVVVAPQAAFTVPYAGEPFASTVNQPIGIAVQQDIYYDPKTGVADGVAPQYIWVVNHAPAADGNTYLDEISLGNTTYGYQAGYITYAISADLKYPNELAGAQGVVAVPWPPNAGIRNDQIAGLYYYVVIAKGYVTALDMANGQSSSNAICTRSDGTGVFETDPASGGCKTTYPRHFTPMIQADTTAIGTAIALGP
jgi:hypothetical protein